jgi:hypothetical protein
MTKMAEDDDPAYIPESFIRAILEKFPDMTYDEAGKSIQAS